MAETEAVRPILARVIQAWPAEVQAGLAAAQERLAQQTGPVVPVGAPR